MLKPLYTVRFWYPSDWAVEMEGPQGRESQHFFLAEGTCTGALAGKFRGANHPRRRTDKTYLPDFQGVIETDDGAVVMFDYQGYGRTYPEGRRQIVGAAWHLSSHEGYKWLNDTVCVLTGEVRAKSRPDGSSELVIDVSELVWEAPQD